MTHIRQINVYFDFCSKINQTTKRTETKWNSSRLKRLKPLSLSFSVYNDVYSPSLALRYTVFATMFSNSINSSLIEFTRPSGRREAWRATSRRRESVGDERKSGRLVRFSGVDHPVGHRQASSHLRPQDTTRAGRSPLDEDQGQQEGRRGKLLDDLLERGFEVRGRPALTLQGGRKLPIGRVGSGSLAPSAGQKPTFPAARSVHTRVCVCACVRACMSSKRVRRNRTFHSYPVSISLIQRCTMTPGSRSDCLLLFHTNFCPVVVLWI